MLLRKGGALRGPQITREKRSLKKRVDQEATKKCFEENSILVEIHCCLCVCVCAWVCLSLSLHGTVNHLHYVVTTYNNLDSSSLNFIYDPSFVTSFNA